MRLGFDKKRFLKVFSLAFGLLTIILIAANSLYQAGFRINHTPSLPVGIWKIDQGFTEIKKGDHVWLTPTKQIADFGIKRGYLQENPRCENGSIPLLKTVYGLPGDTYSFQEDYIQINDQPIELAKRKAVDSKGRDMPKITGGIVEDNRLFVLTLHAQSFDSRYWGTIPEDNIIGTAKPVFVWN